MKKLPALFAALLFAVLLAGCGTTKPGLLGLKAEFVKIERSGDGATATWHLTNPNVVSYIVNESRHKLYVNGRYVGSVATKEAAGVPAQSNVTQSAPIALDKDGTRVLAAAGSSASYRVDSDLTIRLYGEIYEHHSSTAAGTVPIVTK
ncbi:MAG: hypothetical protein HY302_03760 [Opitutae bacterium]|nr:hypothetical protein [Opitutae bacterium]